MKSTMMDRDLQVGDLLRHGQRVHAHSRVVRCSQDGGGSWTFAETAERAERLAAALTRLGVERGDRVATLCWNTPEHMAAYLAVPSMGAVLHTLNLRLHPDQLGYVIEHAEDRVLVVDSTLLGMSLTTLHDHHPLPGRGGSPNLCEAHTCQGRWKMVSCRL